MKSILTYSFGLLALIWVAFFLDTALINVSFAKEFGLIPRTTHGLIGIFGMTFAHANIFHIISNSIPLLVLMILTGVFVKGNLSVNVIITTIIGGSILWVIGRESYHVGASLLVYGLAGLLVSYGIFSKKVIPVIISILVIFFYGTSFLIGLLPIFPGVSWEGHLSGAIGGILTARLITKK
jgi:membrane associated rhomboid family serine protease